MASISEIGRGDKQINLRAPDGLHERIKEAAMRSGRSINSELVHRLEASFEASVSLEPVVAKALERHIEAEVSRRLKAIAAMIPA